MPTEQFMKLKVDRRNSIIKSITRQFATKDYQDVSVRDLADEAGISRGSFYIYFKDKEDAYITSIQSYRERLERDLFNIYMKATSIKHVVMEVFDYFTHLSAFEHSFLEKISNNMSMEVSDIIATAFDKFGETIHEYLENYLKNNGVIITPEITEQLNLRREILFSLLIASLVEMALNRATLEQAREALEKKIEIVLKGILTDCPTDFIK